MSKGLDHLDWAANVFVHRDWELQNSKILKEIRYSKHYEYQDTFKRRISLAFRFLLNRGKIGLYGTNLWTRISMFFYCLKRDKNLPDAVLDNGNIIVYWIETAEYMQLMQPSVGDLLVKFLRDDPGNPHAVKITAELDRLYKKFHEKDNNE